MKKIEKVKIKAFFKKYIVVWILLGVIGLCSLGDYIYYKTFSLELVNVVSEKAPTDELYFSTTTSDEYIDITLKLTSSGKPVKGHSIVAIEKSGGKIVTPRYMTDNDGLAHFVFSSNPVYSTRTKNVKGAFYAYDEDNSIIIEFRLDLYYEFSLSRRPGGE